LIRMEDGVDLLGYAGGRRVGDRAPVSGDVLRDEVVGAGAGELGGAVLAGQPPGRVDQLAGDLDAGAAGVLEAVLVPKGLPAERHVLLRAHARGERVVLRPAELGL